MKTYQFENSIKVAVNILCQELTYLFPGIDFNELKYDAGLEKNVSFKERMVFAIYLELIKAGIITESNYK